VNAGLEIADRIRAVLRPPGAPCWWVPAWPCCHGRLAAEGVEW